MANKSDARFSQQMDAWRRELIDFSRRNRLLNLNTRGTKIDLIEPDVADIVANLTGTGSYKSETALRIVPLRESENEEDLFDRSFESDDESFDKAKDSPTRPLLANEVRSATKDPARLLSHLRSLVRRADQEFLDKGIRILYLAVGTLTWIEKGEDWAGPLLLFPIELRKLPDSTYEFRLNPDEDVALNPALVEKLREDHDLDIAMEIDDEDPLDTLRRLGQRIKGQKGWSVDSRALISTFSFAKDVIFRDLKVNEAVIAANEMVRALAFGADSAERFDFVPTPPDQLDSVAPPSDLLSILDADSTQRAAIIAAREGRSFVLDGPPGTGKSQTIANIIAELMAMGKSVLFVSEKAAALEVVQTRLEASGLGSFLLPLHSQKVSRKDFAGFLGKGLSERAKAGKRLSTAQINRLKESQKQLSAYANALNEIREPLGLSLYQAIGLHSELADVPIAPLPMTGVTLELTSAEKLGIEDAAALLSRSWTQVEFPDSFPWHDLRDTEIAVSRRIEITEKLISARDTLSEAHRKAQAIAEEIGLPYQVSFPSINLLAQLIELTAESRFMVNPDWLTSEVWAEDRARIVSLLSRIESLQNEKRVVEAAVPDWSSKSATAIDDFNNCLKLYADTKCTAPDMNLTPDDVLELIASYDALHTSLGQVSRLGMQLGSKFGDPSNFLTLRKVQDFCDAADLAALAHRPEALWFTAVGITAARDAIEQIEPLVDRYWQRVAKLEELFKRDIVEFPIAEVISTNGTTPKLGLLSGAGRANRRRIAALTISGKLGKDEKGRLQEVLAVSQLREAIQESSEVTSQLGTQYFRGVDTDFTVLNDAVEAARKAVLLLAEADPDKLAAALGRVALDSAETASLGRTIRSQLATTLKAFTVAFGKDVAPESPLYEVMEFANTNLRAAQNLHATLIEHWSERPTQTLLTLWKFSEDIGRLNSAISTFDEGQAEYQSIFEILFDGMNTDTSHAQEALHWVDEVRRLVDGRISPRLATRLCVDSIANSGSLTEHVDVYRSRIIFISELFADSRVSEVRTNLEFDVQGALDLLTALIDNADQIVEDVNFQESCASLAVFGLEGVTSYMRERKVARAEVPPIIEKAVLGAWIEHVLVSDKASLSPIEKINRDQLVSDFAAIDGLLKFDAAARVAEAANSRRPTALVGAVGVINSEASKKTKHMRISDLLNRVSQLAVEIMPCFMMSPVSVSALLPPSFIFDAVIFDEASQLTTANAVNAIYRGRQLIVAGDEKQLPPTRFFERGLNEDDSDEYSDDEVAEFESVLQQAKSGGFRNIGLRWHYRSRHESLITYSNYSFYDGKLITYPGAMQESDSVGVQLVHVPDGVYSRSGRRTNVVEAQKVVERVFHHATHHPELSLGVVAFSSAQENEILDQIEMARRSRPDLDNFFTPDRLNGFFVKNLENVQGDERDIIIFSICYGRDEHGKLTMTFGPVNASGGWRRLNVGFTRARYRVEIVSSITASDFVANPSVNVNHLKRYLDFAERGIAALAVDLTSAEGAPESPFEEEVLKTIASWGFDVIPQVGQAGYRIDMAVRDPAKPGRYVLGIECDGAAYHSSLVARDRDRLRQEVLEKLGWRLHRIWGPSWYRSPKNTKDELRVAIERALAESPATDTAHAVTIAKINNTVYIADFDETSRFVRPYWEERPRNPPLPTNPSVEELVAFITQIVNLEGPISRNLLRRRVADALKRNLTAALKSEIDKRLVGLIRAELIVEVDYDCVGTQSQAELAVARQPHSKDELSKRLPADTPLVEVVGAVAHVIELGHSVEISELVSHVVRKVFGFDRVTAQWKDLIQDAVSEMMLENWWTIHGSVVTRASGFPD
jgi:very-short-patch-repair endonuclease